jgi:hypothetical protein
VNSTNPTTCSSLPTSSVFLSVKPTKSGTIFAVNNSICVGGQVELTLSGQQGNVNKWQRSTDNINWVDISNTTTSLTQTLSSAGTYYYRVQVQTPNCGSAVNSDSKTITVTSGTPPVGGSVSSSIHTTTTNSGTLTLSGYSGSIVKWQRSTNDGVTWTDIVNTTASQSYSNITTKTLFRVQLQSGTCGFAFSSVGTVWIITETISGTVTIPSGLTTRPQLKLYLVDSNGETLLQTITVGVTGAFTLNPTKYNSTYKIVPTYTPSLTSNDFNEVFNESQNENTPTQLQPGLVLNNGPKMKAGDINKDGKINISDAYLLGANISGMIPFNEVYWYTSSDFNSLTLSNFNNVQPVTNFTINFTNTSIIFNIKYIVKGDANLSSSSY